MLFTINFFTKNNNLIIIIFDKKSQNKNEGTYLKKKLVREKGK